MMYEERRNIRDEIEYRLRRKVNPPMSDVRVTLWFDIYVALRQRVIWNVKGVRPPELRNLIVGP